MAANQKPIAVVGGGTAGWLAAMMLKKAAGNEQSLKISVLESPNIPTVGVGEGSTSVFRQVLLDLGIDELEFLRETGATFKFGIKHASWRKDGKSYYGPIDDPNSLSELPEGLPSNWLHHAQIAQGKKVADSHLFTQLMRRRKSAFGKKGGRTIPVSPYHYAYHFDQARLGRFLANKATGIEHVRTEVEGLKRNNETGHITALCCSENQMLPVDFVLDCTGFHRAITNELSREWVSYSKLLPLNKAMPFWIAHDEDKDIPNYTLAKALKSGWMWGIPVQDRMGCGYVFSDAHTTAELAQQEIEETLKQDIQVRNVINIQAGRLGKAWIGNCIALGLAQSFLEPLEATSIHGTLVQLLFLLQQHSPRDLVHSVSDENISSYNQTVARQIDDFAEFINLHYAGGRVDSPFWKAINDAGSPSENQKERLKHWQTQALTRADFQSLPYGLPHVEEQLYVPVLDGLGLLSRRASTKLIGKTTQLRRANKALVSLRNEFDSATSQAIGHRDFLNAL